MTWSAVVDPVYRIPRMTGSAGRGLRGGTVTVTATGSGSSVDYRGTRFTDEVSVTGHGILNVSNMLTAAVVVSSSCGRLGTLTIHARLWDPAHPLATITGTVGGRHVSVTTQTR